MPPDPFNHTKPLKIELVKGTPLPEPQYDLPALLRHIRNNKGGITIWELQRYFNGDRNLADIAMADIDGIQKLVDYSDDERQFPDSPGHVYPVYKLTDRGEKVDANSLRASRFRDVEWSTIDHVAQTMLDGVSLETAVNGLSEEEHKKLELERFQLKFPHYNPN